MTEFRRVVIEEKQLNKYKRYNRSGVTTHFYNNLANEDNIHEANINIYFSL
jgi:hypothetical protein